MSYLVGKEVAKWKKTLTQAPLATAAEDMQAAVMSAFSELVDLPPAPRPVAVAPFQHLALKYRATTKHSSQCEEYQEEV